LTKESNLNSYTHAFNTITIEGLTVTNPKITVVADRMGAQLATNSTRGATQDPYSRASDALIISMNVLLKLYIYVAYGEKKPYITRAGTRESLLFRAAAPTPAP